MWESDDMEEYTLAQPNSPPESPLQKHAPNDEDKRQALPYGVMPGALLSHVLQQSSLPT